MIDGEKRLKKLLIVCGRINEKRGINIGLLLALLPKLSEKTEIRFLSIDPIDPLNRVNTIQGCSVHYVAEYKMPIAKRIIKKIEAKMLDHSGLSDASSMLSLCSAMEVLRREYPFDAILVSVEPFAAACVFPRIKERIRKIAYIMDPVIYRHEKNSRLRFRRTELPHILDSSDLVLTTPFIKRELIRSNLVDNERVEPVGFPVILEHKRLLCESHSEKIRLLFCGWLYSDIRSPKYFLDIVSRLDERFEVTFMGRECELLQERFPIETKAKLTTLPQQPYETALQAMADADIMINIGNSVPVHMPSKTLEYINTGKPMVNFYKMEDCPTLYYTKRYPLALNLYESDADVDQAAKTFVRFCEENKGKTVDRDYILHEYADCTPEYIAQKILDCLEN